MSTKSMSKHALCLLLFAWIFLFATSCSKSNNTTTSQETNTLDVSEYDDDELIDLVLYPHNQVVNVNISMDENSLEDLWENAIDEEYYSCDITYNGFTLENVAIRAKGNSSLRDVYESGDDRFSYNIDLNYYEDQDYFGIDKLILNNLFRDPTMMAEYIAYEALDSLDATASRTTYVALSLNGEYYGLYLSVEHVGNEFLDAHYGNSDYEFYKPDNGLGADLLYLGDTDIYVGLIDKNVEEEETDNTAIINLMETLSTNTNIDEVFDVDDYLKYLAVSTYTVNLDSYQGGIYHNYYLYNNEGVFEWIAWDLNMAFNGFPGVNLTDAEAVEFLIDEPVVNSLSDYPLIESILSDSNNISIYHEYLYELIENYFSDDTFAQTVERISSMIDSYVKTDTNSFYSYSEYLNALSGTSDTSYSIIRFVSERNENVLLQLSGEIPSTNNGLGNIVTMNDVTRPPRP